MYRDITEGCKGLLVTTAKVLETTGLSYVIAGGWVPLLVEPNHPTLTHPGTRDVDVLMVDLERAKDAVQGLLENGFKPSAKHEFQLLREALVRNRTFVFNVDLMHPFEECKGEDMYSDIFDLNIEEIFDTGRLRYVKSIAFPVANVVHERQLYSNVRVESLDFCGDNCEIEIPILSPEACLLSKCESCGNKKRTRDAFDIYYMLTSDNVNTYREKLLNLSRDNQLVFKQMEILKSFLLDKGEVFDRNVAMYTKSTGGRAASHCFEVLFS